ncbi:MAG: UDP-N-acetylmuramate dehydrogenase [Clostridia bacterium]|nr:UDP-N-acetylmuramate dehydrogenase [Clostridia bacterium]
MTDKILTAIDISYKTNEPMSQHTSFKIGGGAEYFVEPSSVDELSKILKTTEENGVPTTVIGNGSNLLVSDLGIEGVVVSTLKMKGIRLLDETHIFAEAGASLTAVCLFAKNNSLGGLEFAYGIPGSVGGALYMNAGAYGGEMSDVVESAQSLSHGEIVERSIEELSLSYRHSVYTDNNEVIVGVTFKLQKGDARQIEEKMNTLMQKRKTSQPLDYPSGGSTFKRPEGYYAAALIDKCGLKGLSVGGAEVSKKHAGFVINRENATCDDVLTLVEKIKEIVFSKKGVKLQTEIIHLGKKN